MMSTLSKDDRWTSTCMWRRFIRLALKNVYFVVDIALFSTRVQSSVRLNKTPARSRRLWPWSVTATNEMWRYSDSKECLLDGRLIMGNAVNVEYQKRGLIISSCPRRAIVLIELLTSPSRHSSLWSTFNWASHLPPLHFADKRWPPSVALHSFLQFLLLSNHADLVL